MEPAKKPQRRPIIIQDPGLRVQASKLAWVKCGERFIVQGIQTNGGFFTQPAGESEVLFAVQTGLPVGDPEKAQHLKLRPNQRLSYRILTPDQRAAYLHSLAGHPCEHAEAEFLDLQLAGLEWLFLTRPESELEVERAAWRLVDNVGTIHCMRRILSFMSWFYEGAPEKQLEILFGSLGEVYLPSAHILQQGLNNLAASAQTIWPDLALALGQMYDAQHVEWRQDSEFQRRFLSAFSMLYPSGLAVPKRVNPKRLQYSPRSWELQRAQLVQPQPCWTMEIGEYITATPLMPALGEVRKRALALPVLDYARMAQLQRDTEQVQSVLGERLPPESELPISPPASKAAPEPDAQTLQIVVNLLGHTSIPAAKFKFLASSLGRMPYALRHAINTWTTENWDEPLLEGEDPIFINQQLRRVIISKKMNSI